VGEVETPEDEADSYGESVGWGVGDWVDGQGILNFGYV
jgi:hypothetical protein